MKKLLILLCYLLFLSSTNSQNKWEFVFESKGNIAKFIESPDSNNTYILFNSGSDINYIYKSTDQGSYWDLQYVDDTKIRIKGMSCPDSKSIWLGYDDGVIQNSINSGEEFEKIKLDSVITIRDMTMFDNNIGVITDAYIIPNIYYILITKNGWKSYEKISINKNFTTFSYWSPKLLNDSILLTIVYESDRSVDPRGIYVQTSFLNLNIYNFEYALNYICNCSLYELNIAPKINTLFACGMSNTQNGGSGHDAIFKSTDSGKNWRRVLDLYSSNGKFEGSYLPPFGIQSIAFKDSLTGIAVGQFGKILYTYDGGESWFYESEPPAKLGGSEKRPAVMKVRYSGSTAIILDNNGYVHKLTEDNIAPGPEHIYTISGRVWEGDKGQAGVPVTLGYRVTMTDSLGYFKFTKVKGGNYYLRAKNKYNDNLYDPFYYQPVVWYFNLSIDTTFNFYADDMRTFHQVSGYVLDTESKGLKNISLKIADSTAVTDNNGKFIFPKIETKRQLDIIPTTEGYSYSPAYHRINLTESDTTDLKFTATPTTSVWESGKDRGIVVSPNPASDYITIQIQPSEGFKPSEGYRVQIFDMLGIEIMSESIHPMTASHRMNVERLPAGVYIIQITQSCQILNTDKIIIVR